MAHWHFPSEPYSRLAVWARRLALLSLIAVPSSVIVLRLDMMNIELGLAIFAAALALAAFAILLGLAAFVSIWREGLRGAGHAVLGIFIGLMLLAYPGYLAAQAYRLPALADISTDPADPPFIEPRRLPATMLALIPASLSAADQPPGASAGIKPLVVAVPAKTAYDTALASVKRNRWHIITTQEPKGPQGEGHIEVEARTPILGLREDIVIRIRSTNEESRIDMRSASRLGFHDLGGNARRIETFFAEMNGSIDAAIARQERLERQSASQKGAGKGSSSKTKDGKAQDSKSKPGAAKPTTPQTAKPQPGASR